MKLIHKIIAANCMVWVLFFFHAVDLKAQETGNDCKNVLKRVNKTYETGNFTEVVEEINACLNKLDMDEKFEAYRMLGLCYMYMNNQEKAHESNVMLLKTKPDYRDFPYFDPVEFTQMLEQYEVWSSFRVGFKAGLNVNSVRPIKNYSITGSKAAFIGRTGYQAGGAAEYFFRNNTSMNIELLAEGLSYKRTADDVSGWNQEFVEKLAYLTVPLSIRQNVFQMNTIGIGLELGLQSQFLLRTHSNIILDNPETGETFQNTIGQKDQRKKILFTVFPGVVVNRKLGEGWVVANLRYGFGLSNIVDPGKRYQNMDFSIANQYIDSDMAFNTFSFSIGYQLPLRNMYTVRLRPE